MKLQDLIHRLNAIGYKTVRAMLADPNTQRFDLSIAPAALRDVNGNWPAIALLDKAGITPADVREFGGELVLRGVDLERVETLPAQSSLPAVVKPEPKKPEEDEDKKPEDPTTEDEKKGDAPPATPPADPKTNKKK